MNNLPPLPRTPTPPSTPPPPDFNLGGSTPPAAGSPPKFTDLHEGVFQIPLPLKHGGSPRGTPLPTTPPDGKECLMGDESAHLKRSHEETATNVAVEHIKYPDFFTKKKGTEHVNFQGNHQGDLMQNA